MRGTKAKRLRNSIEGNPLQRKERLYRGITWKGGAVTVITHGARRVYRVMKALARGQHPQHGVGV
jgi:hypothetical protein